MATAGSGSRVPPDWRNRWAAPPRTAYTSETKPFFLTSEFVIYVLFVMGLAIGTASSDDVDPRLFWILTTVATSFYMLSRGISKSGSREPYTATQDR